MHKLCMIPGPVEMDEEVLAAMATPATSHVDVGFIKQFSECFEMLRRVLYCAEGQPFIVSGSGTLGWDAIACNLMEPGERALVVNTGYFGDSFAACLSVYGVDVVQLASPEIGGRPSLSGLESALREKGPFKLVAFTHVDTSTAVLCDVENMAKLVKSISPQTLVAVDGVCSVAGEELNMDAWGVDIAMTASQKALGVPPGLCILVVSKQAMDIFHNRKSPINNYYASWKNWLPIMNAYEQRRPSYFATPAVQLIMALNVSLKKILAYGMENIFQQHKQISQQVKTSLLEMGFKLVPTSMEAAANTLTAAYYPPGIEAATFLPKIVAQDIIVAGGLHKQMATTYFRIGHMGISVMEESQRHYIARTLEAVKKALN